MQLRRFLILASTVTALLAVPALASAEPVVVPPTPASLLSKKPVFTWAPVANEAVISITVGTSPTLQEDGSIASKGGTYLSTTSDSATSVTGSSLLPAGTYYWQTWWKTIDPYVSQRGAVNTFRVAPYIKAFQGTIQQYSYINAVNVDGQYVTNITTSKLLCQIYNGKRVISSDSSVHKYNTIGGKNRFYCSDLAVSEKLDGTRLKLKVTFISGGKARAVAWKAFTAT